MSASATPEFPVPVCALCESAPAAISCVGEVIVDRAVGPVCPACIPALYVAFDTLNKTPGIGGLLSTPRNTTPKHT